MIHVDTSFLIDLQREEDAGRPGPALEFLETLDDREVLAISVHVLSELLCGVELAPNRTRAHHAIHRLTDGFIVSHTDERFAPAYAKLFASLGRAKRTVPTMDLLIATAALLDDARLVTKNVKDFSRVPGLRLLEY